MIIAQQLALRLRALVGARAAAPETGRSKTERHDVDEVDARHASGPE